MGPIGDIAFHIQYIQYTVFTQHLFMIVMFIGGAECMIFGGWWGGVGWDGYGGDVK